MMKAQNSPIRTSEQKKCGHGMNGMPAQLQFRTETNDDCTKTKSVWRITTGSASVDREKVLFFHTHERWV